MLEVLDGSEDGHGCLGHLRLCLVFDPADRRSAEPDIASQILLCKWVTIAPPTVDCGTTLLRAAESNTLETAMPKAFLLAQAANSNIQEQHADYAQLILEAERGIGDLEDVARKFQEIRESAAKKLEHLRPADPPELLAISLIPINSGFAIRLVTEAFQAKIDLAKDKKDSELLRDSIKTIGRIWVGYYWRAQACEQLVDMDKRIVADQYKKMSQAQKASLAFEEEPLMQSLINSGVVRGVGMHYDRNPLAPNLSDWSILVYVIEGRKKEFDAQALPAKFQGVRVAPWVFNR